jgi:hypothetical protein
MRGNGDENGGICKTYYIVLWKFHTCFEQCLTYCSAGLTQAIQCLGGNGYINEYPTGRLLRDAKLYEIGAGTCEIRRMLIGRELYKNG